MAPEIDIGQSPNTLPARMRRLRLTYQRLLDASVPHGGLRWVLFAFLAILYLVRVISYGGFHIITYGLFIHIFAQMLMLVTPLLDMEESGAGGGAGGELPLTNAREGGDDEFRPFVPVVQEFVAWKSMTQALVVCTCLTMFPFLDIPVYWPILVFYSLVLFVFNMGSRVKHMIKHQYVPWSTGKQRFVPKGKV